MVGTLTDATRHILLAGGGHAHAVALRHLIRRPPSPSVRISVVNPGPRNMYSGALPGVIAGHWPADAIGVNVQALCEAAGAEFVEDAVTGLDPDRGIASLASGREIAFDLLGLDIGSLIRPLNVPDPDSLIAPIRPIGPFLSRWDMAVEGMASGKLPPAVMVVGAGLAGVEVCLAIRHRLSAVLPVTPRIYLADAQENIATTNHPSLRRRLNAALRRADVTCLLGNRIEACEDDVVHLSGGQTVTVSLIVNCAGSAPHAWLTDTGLAMKNGRVEVDECLRSTSHPHVWAAGDTSFFKAHKLEPAGVFAVRAGPVIAENIRRYSLGETLTPFRPQGDYLKLVSLGERRAVAEKYGITFEGGWVWDLKKSIDFSFLRAHDFTARH